MMPRNSSPPPPPTEDQGTDIISYSGQGGGMYNHNSSSRSHHSMNRSSMHSSHSYGGSGSGGDGHGRSSSGYHHHGMNPINNPNMDVYSSSRSRMAMQQNMGPSGPLTPGGGGMGNNSYPVQTTQDSGSPVNAMPNMGYGSGHLDGSMNHHPSMMGNSMYDIRGGAAQSMSYPAGMANSEVVEPRSMMGSRRSGGRSSGGSGGGSSSAAGGGRGERGSSGRSSLSQAEREEELLLNLLIARRQRGRSGGEPSPALREELMRIRQQGGMEPGMSSSGMSVSGGRSMGGGGGSSSGGGGPVGSGNSLSQMHGIPPMYDASASMGAGMMGNSNGSVSSAFPPGVSRSNRMSNSGSYLPSPVAGYGGPGLLPSDFSSNIPSHNNTLQDGAEQRIDRTPHYVMDARTQDMMGYRSGGPGGMPPGGGGGGGSGSLKRSAANMAYDPTGYVPNNHQMKYPSYGMMTHPHTMVHPQAMHGAMGGGQVMMGSGMPPPTKKRRSHKKKPADMPRRPLSAYNLFFSEERERILREIDGDKDDDDEGIKKEEDTDLQEDKDDGDNKPKALLRPLIPSQKKRRPHRKTHGKISFQQLARMVGERWKALPEERRKYYQNLAQEDMKRQKEAMEEYYARQQAIKHGGGSNNVDNKSGIPSDNEDDDVQRSIEPKIEEGMVGGERSDL